MPNVEQILYYLNLDASNMRKGTMAMLDQQKKAAMDYSTFWKKSIQEREQLEIQADVRSATRANRARALHRQRSEERVSLWKKELAAQRMASGVTGEAKNTAGVALSNLKRNVIGGAEMGAAAHLGNSTAMREAVTIMREASRGNWSRIPGSLSIIIQSFGKLGTVVTALVNPITGAIAGLAAGLGMVYKIGYNAQQIVRQSREAGFSTGGYQTFLRQAGRESGGREAAQTALQTMSQNLGQLREGDMGQMRKFQKYGIDITGKSGAPLGNEQIFQNILAKYSATSDPAKRAAIGMDMFGSSYQKFVKTLEEGNDGLQKAMGKGVQSAGQLGVWSTLASNLGDVTSGAWNGAKRGLGSIWNAAKSGYIRYATTVNSGLAGVQAATQESESIDQREQQLIASGKIKPQHMSQEAFTRLHPELAAQYKEATMQQEDIKNEIADRGKLGLSELSEMGRRLSGHIRPRQYTVTARMRTAMKIDDLEAMSTRAWERGDDATFEKLKGQANAMRTANPWLKAMDRNPTRKMEEQLTKANAFLAEVSKMAKFVMSEK